MASTTLESPEWNNSTVIEGDVAKAVADLTQEDEKDIGVISLTYRPGGATKP